MTLIWFFIGIAFFLLELFAPHMVVLFFGIGAWAAGAAALLKAPLAVQCIIFIITSVLLLLFIRSRFRHIFKGNAQQAGEKSAHPMQGQQGVVTRAISPKNIGEISVGGSFWRATAEEELSEGNTVLVLGTVPGEGLILMVQALLQKNSERQGE